MNQPEALRLAEQLEAIGLHGPVAAELRRLHEARERDNVAFKQLLAQRKALLEALRELLSECHDMERDDAIIAAVAKARAVIRMAEGEKA